MKAKGHSRPPHIPLDELLSRRPSGTSRVFGKAPNPRLMTPEERVRFFDTMRSEIKGPVEDTTQLIRRDRDER